MRIFMAVTVTLITLALAAAPSFAAEKETTRYLPTMAVTDIADGLSFMTNLLKRDNRLYPKVVSAYWPRNARLCKIQGRQDLVRKSFEGGIVCASEETNNRVVYEIRNGTFWEIKDLGKNKCTRITNLSPQRNIFGIGCESTAYKGKLVLRK